MDILSDADAHAIVSHFHHGAKVTAGTLSRLQQQNFAFKPLGGKFPTRSLLCKQDFTCLYVLKTSGDTSLATGNAAKNRKNDVKGGFVFVFTAVSAGIEPSKEGHKTLLFEINFYIASGALCHGPF
jgi:hypothetical protein